MNNFEKSRAEQVCRRKNYTGSQLTYRWKILGAWANPNAVTSHSNKPNRVRKAVGASRACPEVLQWLNGAGLQLDIGKNISKMPQEAVRIRGIRVDLGDQGP
jgi:hypothetical protein